MYNTKTIAKCVTVSLHFVNKRVHLLPGFEIREYFTPLLFNERVHLLPRKIIIWSPESHVLTLIPVVPICRHGLKCMTLH